MAVSPILGRRDDSQFPTFGEPHAIAPQEREPSSQASSTLHKVAMTIAYILSIGLIGAAIAGAGVLLASAIVALGLGGGAFVLLPLTLPLLVGGGLGGLLGLAIAVAAVWTGSNPL